MPTLTSIEDNTVVKNPACVSKECLCAAVHLLPDILLQGAQVHWVDNVVKIVGHLRFVDWLEERLTLQKEARLSTTAN